MTFRLPIAMAVIAVTLPVAADPPAPAFDADRATNANASNRGGGSASVGFRGWGLRAGVADDIDQVVAGAHFNLGEMARNLRFQPDVQLGAGDDHTTLYGTAPVYYRFDTNTRFTPYAGGGISAGFVDRDGPGGGNSDDTEFEVGLKATGGLEWPRRAGQAFFLELSLGFGDVHDAQIIAAWSF